jgi:hypothetical protein
MDLSYFARKYIWWQAPEAAIADRHRIIAQVMDFPSAQRQRWPAYKLELK